MQVYLLVTQDCNLDCHFCIRGGKIACQLDLAKWEGVLKRNDFSRDTLLITGGEPSVFPCLPDLLSFSASSFRGICVHTNGVDSSWIRPSLRNICSVQISIDGTKMVHNALRGGGSVDVSTKIEQTISRLNDIGGRFCVSTTVSKRNVMCISEMVSYVECLPKIMYWKVSPQLPFGCGNWSDCLSVLEWNEMVEKLVHEVKIPLRIHKLFDFELLQRYRELNGRLPEKARNCGNVSDKVYVYPDLTVYPCTCLTDFALGNLERETMESIKRNAVAKRFTSYAVDSKSKCHSCEYVSFCNGGCIGMSYAKFGRLGMGDPRCPLNQQ